MAPDGRVSRRTRLWDMLDLSRSRSRSRSTSRPPARPTDLERCPEGEQDGPLPVPVQFEDSSHAVVANGDSMDAGVGSGSATATTPAHFHPQETTIQIKVEQVEPDNIVIGSSGLSNSRDGHADAGARANQADLGDSGISPHQSGFQEAVSNAEVNDSETTRGDEDIWSVAYREAICRLDEDKREIVAKGARVDQLFKDLGDRDAESAENSLFRKGLKKLQKPLQYVKLAVDLAQPLTGLEPAVGTAAGAVKSFTIVAIGVCGANEALTTQITQMLEHTAIIDECDTLGQKLTADNTIFEVLVPVYVDLLDFYIAAVGFFSKRTTALQLLSEALNYNLPPIIKNFLHHAARLQHSIQNATLRLVDDIGRLLLDDKILKRLGVDKERKRSEHHCSIRRTRADDACTWVTQSPVFREWYDASTSSFLVMFGGMGCGKTVTTAFVIDHVVHLNKHALPRPLICYHYCNTDENSDAIYIYSSLLLQLLGHRPALKITFDKWYEDTKKVEFIDPAQSPRLLGEFFADCVKSLERTVFVVIDAMDECNDQSLPELISLLQSISERTPRLKVFLSSRPDEWIEELLSGAAQIHLLPDAQRDAVILDYLVSNNLKRTSKRIQSLVANRLCEVADGSAIWMKLTVDLIQRRGIASYDRMTSFLKEMPLPADLSKLYLELFRQATKGEDENERLATRALEILAVARRPLSILELGWASALIDMPEVATKLQDVKGWVDEKRVLSLVQPFVGSVDFQDLKKRQVRLAHQSIRQLILRCPPPGWEALRSLHRISETEKPHVEQRQSALEAQLLSVCVRYLLLDEFDTDARLFSADEQAVQELAQMPFAGGFENDDEDDDDAPIRDDAAASGRATSDTDTVDSSAPIYFDPSASGFGEFFVYASCCWLEHFRAAAWELSPPITDIILLCRAGSERLRNWTDQYCRPDCTVLPGFWWDAELDPLVVVSTFGPMAAVDEILSGYDIAGPDFLVESISMTFKHLIHYGRVTRICRFFRNEHIGLTPQTVALYMLVMRYWNASRTSSCGEDTWTEFFDLIHDMIPALLIDSWGNELLCHAAATGCVPVLERLFAEAERSPELRAELLRDRQRQTDPSRHNKHQSVGEAAYSNHAHVVRYLLQQPGIEAHLRHRDLGGRNVFFMTPRWNNSEAVVQLLMEHYPEGASEVDEAGDTPLHAFLFASASVESVKILLAGGRVDVNGSHSHPYWHPLRTAVRGMNVEMCRTLVEVGGADPRAALRVSDDGRVLGLADSVHFRDDGAEWRLLDMFCRQAGLETPETI